MNCGTQVWVAACLPVVGRCPGVRSFLGLSFRCLAPPPLVCSVFVSSRRGVRRVCLVLSCSCSSRRSFCLVSSCVLFCLNSDNEHEDATIGESLAYIRDPIKLYVEGMEKYLETLEKKAEETLGAGHLSKDFVSDAENFHQDSSSWRVVLS